MATVTTFACLTPTAELNVRERLGELISLVVFKRANGIDGKE